MPSDESFRSTWFCIRGCLARNHASRNVRRFCEGCVCVTRLRATGGPSSVGGLGRRTQDGDGPPGRGVPASRPARGCGNEPSGERAAVALTMVKVRSASSKPFSRAPRPELLKQPGERLHGLACLPACLCPLSAPRACRDRSGCSGPTTVTPSWSSSTSATTSTGSEGVARTDSTRSRLAG